MNTQEDHLILFSEFFAVCQEYHTRLKLEKCQFMQDSWRLCSTWGLILATGGEPLRPLRPNP